MPAHEILVFVALSSNNGSDVSAHMSILARTCAARIDKVWVYI